jgi:hypothetical protein
MREVYLTEIAFYKEKLLNNDLTPFMRHYYMTLLIERYNLMEALKEL